MTLFPRNHIMVLCLLLVALSCFSGYEVSSAILRKSANHEVNRTSSLPRVAICIGGQQSRMQPRLLRDGLLWTNDDDFYFDLFYNLQISSSSNREEVIFNTDPEVTFNSSTFGKMNASAVVERLYSLIHHPYSSHSKIVSVQFHKLLSLAEVESIIGYNLTLFEVEAMKSRQVQSTILNMYLHQMRCIEQINQYEQKYQFTYDYVISTREDVIFMRPMNLTYVLTILDAPGYDAVTKQPRRKCHMVMKECASFFGYNQRMFVYDRQTANVTLTNRWNYFKYLLSQNVVLMNTEVFELEMAKYYQFRGCPIFIDYFAVTAVRPVDGEIYCFPYWEILNCLPSNPSRKITRNKCERYHRAKLLTMHGGNSSTHISHHNAKNHHSSSGSPNSNRRP